MRRRDFLVSRWYGGVAARGAGAAANRIRLLGVLMGFAEAIRLRGLWSWRSGCALEVGVD
jgi:hypothetical protein